MFSTWSMLYAVQNVQMDIQLVKNEGFHVKFSDEFSIVDQL